MIKRIDNLDDTGIVLRDSHYSRVILSHMAAYGSEYDFCEFYELRHRNRRIGIISSFNSSLAADLLDVRSVCGTCIREMNEFISFKSPAFAEMPRELMPKVALRGYRRVKRRFYEVTPADSSDGLNINPDPEYVYKTAMGDGKSDYGLWLTDTMRRINRGISELYSYESSVLTVRFHSGGMAYISDVATPVCDRGKGYARELLGRTAKLLLTQGYRAYLCAGEEVQPYYEKLGYKLIAEDFACMKKEDNSQINFKHKHKVKA